MKLTIEIDIGSEAFEHDEGMEVVCILSKLSRQLENGVTGNDYIPLFDSNGNRAGYYKTTSRLPL